MCGPYALPNGDVERYEGIWMFEWAAPDLPPPATGEYGYRWYTQRTEDPSLGEVQRWGDDACYRSAGDVQSRWSVNASGDVTDTGERETAAFLFSFRSSEAPDLPPPWPGLNG